MKKLAVLAIAGLISASASAVNWVVVDYNQAMSISVDTDSISRSGKYKSSFVLFRLTRPMPLGSGIYSNLYIDSYSAHQLTDCNSNPRKSKAESIIFRYGKQVVTQRSDDGSSDFRWMILHPGSLGYSAANLICSR